MTATSGSMPSASTGASDSMPSTATPAAMRSSMSAAAGVVAASAAARARTAGVSRTSRHGGACSTGAGCPSSTGCERWSATANGRISSTSSSKNSRRSAVSAVGGKMSMMPPRTAYSPRRDTMSTREYASPDSVSASWVRSIRSPARSTTGSSSPRPLTSGWRAARTGAMTTRSGVSPVSVASGWARRWRTVSRSPTVSDRGESRSCGNVSQEGNTAIDSAGRWSSSARARSCDSRVVAVTTSAVPVAAVRAMSAGSSPRTSDTVPPGDVGSATARRTSSKAGSVRAEVNPVSTRTSLGGGADTGPRHRSGRRRPPVRTVPPAS